MAEQKRSTTVPKEQVAAAPLDAGVGDDGGRRVHNRATQITWHKDGEQVVLTPSFYVTNAPDGRPPHPDLMAAWPDDVSRTNREDSSPEGWYAIESCSRVMSWQQINQLIRVLKRARDDAFGKPE